MSRTRPAIGPALKFGTDLIVPTDLPQKYVPAEQQQPRAASRQKQYQAVKRRRDRLYRLCRDYIPVLGAVAVLFSLLVLGGILYTYSGDRGSPSLGSLTADSSHPSAR